MGSRAKGGLSPCLLLVRSVSIPSSVFREAEEGTQRSKGGFLFSQAVLPLLLQATDLEHPPTLLFTGATASVRGSAYFAPFASGKFALRALAQSLAREFGPKGVHVSHVIVDGVIDIPRTKGWTFEHPDAKLSPDAVREPARRRRRRLTEG